MVEGEIAFDLENFSKIQAYLDCLRNPTTLQGTNFRKFKIRGMKMNERLLAFVITWVLDPRGSNHAKLLEDGMLLIHACKNGVQLHCLNAISEVMLED